MPGEVTFLRMPRSKPKTSAEGQEQLSNSLARMASAPVASKRVPITEVGFAQCRFVVDDRSFPALCCGEPTLGGSWCAQHRALVFVRVAAPNHRKSAQEPPKVAAAAVPNGPSKQPNPPAAKPVQDNLPVADKQKSKTQHAGASTEKGNPPPKDAKPRADVSTNKDGSGTAERGPHDRKESVKVPPKGGGKAAEAAAVKRSGSVTAKKPEPSRKAAAKPPAKKTTPSQKGSAAKAPASAKKAESRKSSVAKRPASAKKTTSRKSVAVKRALPTKKPAAARKSTAVKGAASAKKSAAGKRKSR